MKSSYRISMRFGGLAWILGLWVLGACDGGRVTSPVEPDGIGGDDMAAVPSGAGGNDSGSAPSTPPETGVPSEPGTPSEPQPTSQVTRGNIMPERTGSYLIIATAEANPWLADFVSYRSGHFKVTVGDADQIGNTTEKIKAYIQARYDDPATRPEYLLLVMKRDTDRRKHAIAWYELAAQYDWGTDVINSYAPYAYLHGEDQIPDVYLGVFSVLDKSEVDNALAKIREVESHGQTFPRKVGYFCSLGQDNWNRWDSILGSGWTSVKYDVVDGNQPVTTPILTDMLNAGLRYFWVNGHGAPTGVVGAWGEWVLNAAANVNSRVYPLVSSGGCNTGNWFLNGTTSGPTIWPEFLVFKAKGPAVAVMVNSSYGGHYDVPFTAGILGALQAGVSNLGALFQLAVSNSLNSGRPEEQIAFYAFNNRMIHLWGDPATELNGRDRGASFLHVVYGSGGGVYAAGQTRNVAADPPENPDCRFDRWAGDVFAIADPRSAATTVRMPDRDVQLEATYRCDAFHPVPGKFQAESFADHLGGLPPNPNATVASQLLGGNWIDYRLSSKKASSYTVRVRYASMRQAPKISLKNADSGEVLGTFSLPLTNSDNGFAAYNLDQHQERDLSGPIQLPAGDFTLRLTLVSGYISLDWLELK